MSDSASSNNAKFQFPWRRRVADFTPPMAAKRSSFARFDAMIAPAVTAFEKSATVHLIGYLGAIVSFGAVILGVYQFWGYLGDRAQELAIIEEEREARIRDREIQEEERYERAWDRLLRRDPGDTRKGRAVNALLDAGVSFEDLDLSCKTIGVWDDKTNSCTNSPVLTGLYARSPFVTMEKLRTFVSDPSQFDRLFFAGLEFEWIDMSGFNDLVIKDSSFTGMQMGWPDPATEANIDESDFSMALISDVVAAPKIIGSDLSYSIWDLYGHGPSPLEALVGNNLTGVTFVTGTEPARAPLFSPDQAKNESFQGPMEPPTDTGWAWADRPPMQFDPETGVLEPATIYLLHGIMFVDPRCRVNYDDRSNRGLVELTGPDLQGMAPQIRPGLDLSDPSIYEITWSDCAVGYWPDAARLFPDRYPTVPEGYRRTFLPE